VETLALLPWILRNGPEAFTAYGTNKSTGTKIFALAGRVRRGGLVEVPMGMTIKEIIMEVGGGIQGDGEFKAVQIGGPSGGCIPAMLADTPIDYEALAVHGSMMGSGGMIVLDQTDCLVDIARYFMSFMQAESCGKCIPCRRGTKMMLEMLEKLCMGQAQEGVLGELESLGAILRETSLCGLGKTAANPVLTSLRYFRDEYEAHLAGECPARRCKQLIEYFITSRCIGCTRCAQGCPVKAIPLTPHQRHVIDTNTCIRCNTCREVCPSHAVEVQGKGDKMSTGL
jgi:NADH-quinone oxidoreductase subunit F